ncbi:MAG: cytochrome B6 [Deltaproteobacteria bacterium CG11_big_fil_rev_8_21_14_0_20_49_13]|nr:MAG: cytochrome B6 [Deltaproteobacteria bacterium CG11_big_fil_rev_8_21_14_0_20_49_13]
MTETDIAKRNFLTKLVGGVLGVTAVIFAAPFVRYLIPKKNSGDANILTSADGKPVLEKEIKENSSFVGFSKSGPTIIIKRDGKLRALSAVCTHLGCLVKWIPNEGVFFCPCHAGKFDANGVNISGPPPEPLTVYNVTVVEDGTIALEKS